jgi:hypothetical protein
MQSFHFGFFLVDDIDVDGPCDIDSGNSTNHSPDDAQRNLLTTSTTEGKLHYKISKDVEVLGIFGFI